MLEGNELLTLGIKVRSHLSEAKRSKEQLNIAYLSGSCSVGTLHKVLISFTELL